jgi:hypothetical protein
MAIAERFLAEGAQVVITGPATATRSIDRHPFPHRHETRHASTNGPSARPLLAEVSARRPAVCTSRAVNGHRRPGLRAAIVKTVANTPGGPVAAAQRAAGQWAVPEDLIARLADGFTAAAQHETDTKQRKRFRRVGRTLSGAGHDAAVEIAADAITRLGGLD